MSTPYRHWEIIDRGRTGKFMDEDDFLPRHFSPTLKKLIKKYEIKYDPKDPCPSDEQGISSEVCEGSGRRV